MMAQHGLSNCNDRFDDQDDDDDLGTPPKKGESPTVTTDFIKTETHDIMIRQSFRG